ncbi:BON domain-containing protein [Noviherbaspirillum sp.]|uniref:BON domain-containing protein n=1 Tax=Noviherbaspirillum sp. TaxID=1926288 RepID=UPI002FE322C5
MKTAISISLVSAALALSACASSTQNPDAQLASQIKQDIARTEGIGSAQNVNVETARGVVILSGFIDGEKQKQDAGQAALKVSGVQQVFNNLQVRSQTSSGQ